MLSFIVYILSLAYLCMFYLHLSGYYFLVAYPQRSLYFFVPFPIAN